MIESIFNPPFDPARWMDRIEAGLPIYVGVYLPENTAVLMSDRLMVDSQTTLKRLLRAMNRQVTRGWWRSTSGYRCDCGKVRNTLRSLLRHRAQKHYASRRAISRGLRNPQ